MQNLIEISDIYCHLTQQQQLQINSIDADAELFMTGNLQPRCMGDNSHVLTVKEITMQMHVLTNYETGHLYTVRVRN